MLLLLLGKVVNDQRRFGVSGMLFMHNSLKTFEALYLMLTVVITREHDRTNTYTHTYKHAAR